MDDKNSEISCDRDVFENAIKKASCTKIDDYSDAIENLIMDFEEKSNFQDNIELWYARDLQILLGYSSSWQNFSKVIEKAKNACSISGHLIENHFNDVIKMVEIGSSAERETQDIKLTRYACYLIAQNSDSRKKPVAFAQTYFAIQTRRQELQDIEHNKGVTEQEKRSYLREQIRLHNKKLITAAKNSGVGVTGNPKLDGIEFACFHNAGYKGLYGGLDEKSIKRKKKLKNSQKILDHMGSTELAANFFRVTQTEEKLKRENIQGKDNANLTHYSVGHTVRDTIKQLGSVLPEDLPIAESIKKIKYKESK
jgi:DNA-damage-inducible protein D